METLVQIAGLCLAASVTASLLRHSSPELALVLALAAALLGGTLLLRGARDAAALGDELVALTGLSPELFTPLLKVTAIALIVRIVGALCADAGQSALSRVMEAAGAFCALGCALPLLRALAELLQQWI